MYNYCWKYGPNVSNRKSTSLEGVKKLAVVTPAFVSDCLETLEEIAMEGKEDYLSAGGEEFVHVACLNDYDPWVEVMANWVKSWDDNSQVES